MKLRNNKGETLVEVLASIVIASLSVALLFGCIMGSSGMDKTAREADEPYYKALSAAEARKTGGQTAQVAITKARPTGPAPSPDVAQTVTIFGEDGVYSYKVTP